MTDSGVAPRREMHPDEMETEDVLWSRRDELQENIHSLLSHHPPSLYGHCLRLSLGSHSVYFCGRCSGIYGGLGLGVIVLMAINVRLEPSWAWFFGAVAVGFATVIDWSTHRLSPRRTTARTRALTGLVSGLSLAVIFVLGNVIYILIALSIMLGTIAVVSIVESRMTRMSSV